MRLRVLALGDDMMSPTARWSWKSLGFLAITAPRKNMARRPRQTAKGTTLSVEYSREGSKAVLEFGPTMSPSGNTRPREHDANPNPWFLSPRVFLRSLAEKRENPL